MVPTKSAPVRLKNESQGKSWPVGLHLLLQKGLARRICAPRQSFDPKKGSSIGGFSRYSTRSLTTKEHLSRYFTSIIEECVLISHPQMLTLSLQIKTTKSGGSQLLISMGEGRWRTIVRQPAPLFTWRVASFGTVATCNDRAELNPSRHRLCSLFFAVVGRQSGGFIHTSISWARRFLYLWDIALLSLVLLHCTIVNHPYVQNLR